MKVWSFYDSQTGTIDSCVRLLSDGQVGINTPAGHVAIEGEYDHLSQRVDIATGEVVDWQPPAPPDDEMQTWAWDAEAKRWRPVPTLAARRAAKWTQIKAARDSAEFGGFTWDGSRFDSDATSQSRIQGAAQLATLAMLGEQPFAVDWTLADNAVRTLSGAEMIAAGEAMGVHIMTAHGIGRALREAIEAANDAAALEEIQWPA